MPYYQTMNSGDKTLAGILVALAAPILVVIGLAHFDCQLPADNWLVMILSAAYSFSCLFLILAVLLSPILIPLWLFGFIFDCWQDDNRRIIREELNRRTKS